MTNEQKIERAKAWMQSRGIQIKEGQWKGPAVPVPNLAGQQPVLTGYDCGMMGQIRSLLRLLP